jgi:hypothetical protein
MRCRKPPPEQFEGNIATEKARLRAQVAELDALLKKLRQLDTASFQVSEWLFSPELRAPE